jgi:hypothetical protein
MTVLWTPAYLAVPAKAWWDGDQLVFSGSNVSSWANTGSFGGSATVNGPPTKAATLNGLNGVQATGTGQNITQSMAFGSSGQLFAFVVANIPDTNGTATHGLFADGNGVNPTGTVAVYLSVGDPGGGIFAGANGYSGNPNLGGFPATFAAGARIHGIQLGSTNGHWVDGTAQTLSDDNPATVPNYTTPSSWVYLDSFNPNTGEQLNGAQYQFLLLTYFPTTAERQLLEGWAAWKYGLQANLPGGHPYKSAAPTVNSGASAVTLGAMTAAGTGTLALKGTLSKTLDAVTAAATGKLALKASATVTLGAATLAATGIGPSITGAASIQLGAATLAATGKLAIKATLSTSLENVALVTTGRVAIKGTLTATLGAVSLAATGAHLVPISGMLAVTLADLLLSGSGGERIIAHPLTGLSISADPLSGGGSIIAPPLAGRSITASPLGS